MNNVYRSLLLLVLLAISTNTLHAQCDPVLRPDSTQIFFDGGYIKASVKVGNTLYLGGDFTSAKKNTGSLAKVTGSTGRALNYNGDNKLNGSVFAAVEDGNGGWIIGGSFTLAGSVTRNCLAQINAAGKLTTWNPNVGGQVNALYRNGNTLYVGGNFISASGQSRNRIAAYDLTTGNLTTWNPNVNGVVRAITGSGSNIYIGGTFGTVGGQTRNHLAAVTAATGAVTSWNPNISGLSVNTLVVSGGTIYVGGSFFNVGSSSRQNAACISLSTAAATTWVPDPNNAVYDIVLNGSNIFLGGSFTMVGGVYRAAFGEVDNNTGITASTNLVLPTGTVVYDIEVSGSNFYIGSNFTMLSGKRNVAKYNLSTKTLDNDWGADVNGIVYVVRTIGSDVLLGGNFTQTVKKRMYAAAYDMLADTLTTWNPDFDNGINAIASDGNLVYLGGWFLSVGGLPFYQRLVSVDPVTALPNGFWQPNPNGVVEALIIDNGRLYVGGDFTQMMGNSRSRLASLNMPAGSLTSWNPGANGHVLSMQIDGGTLFAGGKFSTAGGAPRNRLAAIPTGSNTATTWNPNITSTSTAEVRVIKKVGNTIYTGGSFEKVGAQNQNNFAAIDATTGLISAPMPGTDNYVAAIEVDGNSVYIGGAFLNVFSTPVSSRYFAASINAVTGQVEAWDPSPDGMIGYAVKYGDKLWMCGLHTNISGQGKTPKSTQYIPRQSAPTVTITGNDSLCAGTPITYTAYTSAAGASYQWKVNNANVGTNSTTYTATLSPGDEVKVDITIPTGTCYTTTTATSNVIKVYTYTGAAVPSITVSGATTVCTGSVATYTATTNVTGGTIQWKVNGINAGTNSTTYNYTPANGDIVTAVVTVPAVGCFTTTTATSNAHTIAVNNPVAPTISISTPSTTVCAGQQIVLTPNSNVTGGTYEWYVNSALVSTNPNLAYIPANGDNISCTVTIPVGGCFLSTSATSNTISITVNPATTTPTISVTANKPQVCEGETVNYSATTNVTGATYEWRVNGNPAGTNSNAFSHAPSIGDLVTCTAIVPANACFTMPSVTSAPALVQVMAPTVPTVIVASTPTLPVCEGTNVTFAATSNVSNGTYIWKVNGSTVGGNNTAYSYVPQNGDIIFCTVITSAGCYTPAYAASPIMLIDVDAKQPVSFTLGAAPIVELGGTVYVHAVIPTGITNYSIEWKRNGTTYATTTGNTSSYPKIQGIDTLTAILTTPDGCNSPGTTPAIYVYSVGTNISEAIKSTGIETYPNPFNDHITIKGTSATDQQILFDMSGRSITPSAITNSNGAGITLQFSDIAPGAYLLKIITADGHVKANIPLRKM